MKKEVNNFCYAQALNALPLFDHIEYYDMGYADGKINIGVNWSAIGTTDADETEEFAANLMEAAKAAREFCFNGYIKVYAERN